MKQQDIKVAISANSIELPEPVHPGEIIKDEIAYLGLSQRTIAKEIGVSATQLNEVLNAKRPLSSEYALLLEAALGVDAPTLVRMQARYDMIMARRNKTLMERLGSIRRVAAVL